MKWVKQVVHDKAMLLVRIDISQCGLSTEPKQTRLLLAQPQKGRNGRVSQLTIICILNLSV